MSKVFIEESTLTAIGNAIREKEGTTALITPGSMASRISNLPSGGGEVIVDDLSVEMISGNGSGISALPSGITDIRQYAFAYMKQLALTELPDSVVVIDNFAFVDCENMNLSKLPNSLEEIGGYAFQKVKFPSTLVMPAGVKDIAGNIFGPTSYSGVPTEIIFLAKPRRMSISRSAFSGMTGITSIKVPWSQGEVDDAPWGATNATITYNYIHEEA